MKQTQRIISEELSDNQKYLKMRSRPKVLMAKNYEEALTLCEKYKEYLLCVISDVEYHKGGNIDHEAGLKLIKKLLHDKWDIPMLIQSSDHEAEKRALQLGIPFINKQSSALLFELRSYILNNLGFGDFIFRDQHGNEIDRASTLKELEKILPKIPPESLRYHSRYNHFSAWLIAHGEFQVARKIRPLKDSDFSSTEDHNKYLTQLFKEVRIKRNKGKIINFDADSLGHSEHIILLSKGSLGGKGRGLAFFNALLATINLNSQFPDSRICIPPTAIIGTSEFDQFIEKNKLYGLDKYDDSEIKNMFVNASLSPELRENLKIYLEHTKTPLAVRSSGLLEDSQSQPFAGVYQTFMLPNCSDETESRLENLEKAVKLVFSSVFLNETRNYIKSLNYRIEEEKMAVVIQEIVGSMHETWFYPHFSGVAQSYNYYPVSYMQHSDGVSTIAAGLGQAVIEGKKCFRFCPKYPNLSYGAIEDIIKTSQTDFYALDMNCREADLSEGETVTLEKLPVSEAERHGTLQHLASVWDHDNQRIVEGLSEPGPRVVNFGNILKYNVFPLADILNNILEFSEKALGIPVEIEFAVNLDKNEKTGNLPSFYLLQARPLAVSMEEISINITDADRGKVLLYTDNAMGHGIIDDIHDLIAVIPENFDNTKTTEMQLEIEKMNKKFNGLKSGYILIGPGRWGTRDRFLGVPVTWPQISHSRIIAETGLENFDIEPSQGTHFFHNLIAMNVGYFYIKYRDETGYIDWNWIKEQKTVEKGTFFVHIKTLKPFKVRMDGKSGSSVIFKP
jgi:hypothetical protein